MSEHEEQVSEVEQEARLLGWVPEEEFRGDKSEWADAETFVKRGKEINPILRKNNERLLKEIKARDTDIENMKVVFKEVERMQKAEQERQVKELQAEISFLKDQKKQALKDNDGDKAVELDDQIDELKEQVVEAKKPKEEPKKPEPKVELDPVVSAWMEKNTWFGEQGNEELTQMVDILGRRINRANPELRGQAFFDKLDEELRDRFPEQFGGKTPRSPVEGSNRRGAKKGPKDAHTFENLPEYAKQAFNNMKQQGRKITKEQYVEYFEWDE